MLLHLELDGARSRALPLRAAGSICGSNVPGAAARTGLSRACHRIHLRADPGSCRPYCNRFGERSSGPPTAACDSSGCDAGHAGRETHGSPQSCAGGKSLPDGSKWRDQCCYWSYWPSYKDGSKDHRHQGTHPEFHDRPHFIGTHPGNRAVSRIYHEHLPDIDARVPVQMRHRHWRHRRVDGGPLRAVAHGQQDRARLPSLGTGHTEFRLSDRACWLDSH
mmetsp:Transcript_99387/g.301700  ORF Transcript_99387/g.301700 Transcript_99387/m.301700 type:complete len:220 (-) Transcript_99387:117-776(-)